MLFYEFFEFVHYLTSPENGTNNCYFVSMKWILPVNCQHGSWHTGHAEGVFQFCHWLALPTAANLRLVGKCCVVKGSLWRWPGRNAGYWRNSPLAYCNPPSFSLLPRVGPAGRTVLQTASGSFHWPQKSETMGPPRGLALPTGAKVSIRCIKKWKQFSSHWRLLLGMIACI